VATIPLPLVGPTYTNRSLPVSSQVTRNFYIEVNQQGGEPLSLMPFPGLKPWSTGAGENRGMGSLNGVLYTISGNTLYSVESDGTQTSAGTIDGTGRCSIDSDGSNLVIATGESKPYTYDGSTLTLGTDEDLPNADTVTYINRRMVYDGAAGNVVFADLDEPLSAGSLTAIKAESKPDDMVAVDAYKQQVYAYGAETIQPLYATGDADSPYLPILNATQEIGLAAAHSVATNNNYAYFLGSDRNVYQLGGLDVRPISNPAIGQEIAGYSDVSDAFGVCFTLDSMNFYLLSFPEGNKTWLFNEAAGLWTELAYNYDGSQHLISDYANIYGKHLVADRRNGNIYELDFDTYTDNGDPIHRRRDTISINGATFGKPNARVFMDKLTLVIQPGASLVTSKATVIMQYSDDNGQTWSSERWASVGEMGDYTYKLDWLSLGYFYNRMFRFTMTDPIKWVLISANADVELEIG